ncbi:MAG TPA: RimK/LysX family protein [Salinisphaeraceae bacterium]|nr:RimK/LysX family protein [Salinisphaeraceae bacterium]
MQIWRLLIAVLILILAGTVSADEHDSVKPKTIFGLHEQVYIKDLDITLPAKLDTGAGTASLSARNIEIIEEDDEEYVQFDLALNDEDKDELDIDEEKMQNIRLPLDRHIRIIRRSESLDEDDKYYSRRPVVNVTVCLGRKQADISIDLTDRSNLEYPLLMGYKGMRLLEAVVDPSVSMTAGQTKCFEEEGKSDQASDEESDDKGDDEKDDEDAASESDKEAED